jgi:tetratricopeptide (TPR) repeat protein
VTARLNRVEKRVFGQALTGSPQERIAKLAQAVPVKPLQNEAPSSVASFSDDERSVDNVSPTVASQPARQQAQQPVKRNDEADKAYSFERARIAVLAAKEEEIGGLLAEAVQLWRGKRPNEALERFEQVIRLDPANAEAHFSMGIIEEGSGNFIEALSSYQKAARLKPENGDYGDAIKAVEKKLNAKQAFDSRQSELTKLSEDALAAYKRGQYMFALDLYKQLDAKRPNQALIKYNIGTMYMMLKIPHKALEFYRQALALSPSDPRYVQAVQKVQALVPNAEMDPVQAASPKKSKQVKMSDASVGAPPTVALQDALNNYGIAARSGGKGVVITTIDSSSRAGKAGLQKATSFAPLMGLSSATLTTSIPCCHANARTTLYKS